MQFSVRTLLLFTTAVAVTVASLMHTHPIIGDLYYTLGLLTIAFAIFAAVYHRGPQRAFWAGFVVLFAGYYCHTVWPSEIRGPLNAMRRMGSLGISNSGIVTTKLLNLSFEGVHGDSSFPSLGNPYNQSSLSSLVAEQYVSFMTIGHTAFAFLFGVIGGAVARRFALHAESTKKVQIERAAASPPSTNGG